LKIRCPSLQEQDAYLASLNLTGFIPYNSDNRRNIGYLMALESGAEVCISIDDDNYARPSEQFFAEHSIVASKDRSRAGGRKLERLVQHLPLMEVDPPNVYPRGFPYSSATITRRSPKKACRAIARQRGAVAGEPDLDAMTWLVCPARSKRISHASVVLGDRAWSPINTQNTSLHTRCHRQLLLRADGLSAGTAGAIDRYGDILSGYLAQACVRHVGHRIRVGTPAVDHRRNSHHYMRDATHEMGCVWLMEDLTEWLTELKLTGSTYQETYLSLASQLDDAAEKFNGYIWNDATRGYVHQLAYCMRRWATTCRRWL
jgi:hypothetical protein